MQAPVASLADKTRQAPSIVSFCELNVLEWPRGQLSSDLPGWIPTDLLSPAIKASSYWTKLVIYACRHFYLHLLRMCRLNSSPLESKWSPAG